MLEGMIAGFGALFSWPALAYALFGSAVGLIFGILPGLQGSLAMAMLIPMTFGMPPTHAVPLLIGAWGASEGSATAILLNVPGESENAATTFDGYPMAQQGRAGEALSAAAFSSMMGALFGVAVFLVLLPVLRSVVLSFGPPEFFMLAIAGLVSLAAISRGSLLKGLVMITLGMAMALHGTNPITGGIRYTFGSLYLWEGVPLLPTLIGLFGLAETIKLMTRNTQIVQSNVLIKGGVLTGIMAVVRNWHVWLSGASIGTFIGAIPGVGGSVASYLSYTSAVLFTGKGEKFGNGNIKGVIAPEASNNAKDGGALIPALILGIPGSTGTAILLTALMFHGIVPGRKLVTERLDLVWVILLALVLANVVAQSFVMFAGRYLARLTVTPSAVLAPIIGTTCLVGAFVIRRDMNDVILAVGFGVLGYVLDKYGYPKIGILMALILTPLAEQSLHTSLQMSEGSYAIFFNRPPSLTMALLMLLVLVVPVLRQTRARTRPGGQAGKVPA